MPPLALLGSLSRDRIGGGVRVGGGAFHGARGLQLAGARATVVAKSAPELLPPLEALGLPVRFRAAAATSTFAFALAGEERRLEVEEVGEPWTPQEARGWAADALGDARWVHVAPLLRSDFPAATLAELARGRRLLLDAQGLVRVPRTGPLALDARYDRDLLRHVAVLKLAEEEARVLLPDLDAATLAGLGVAEVLVTFGSRGSLVCADGRCERVAAEPVDADATGAGDAYAAVYLAGRASGAEPVEAARRAARLVEALLAVP